MVVGMKLYFYDIGDDDDMPSFSHRMKRQLLSEYLGCAESDIVIEENGHGKPLVTSHPVHVSISHSGRVFAMAITKDNIGIDIERHKPRKNMTTMIEEYFHPEEARYYATLPTDEERLAFFYDLWTKKEAYAKYLGLGLGYKFSADNFVEDDKNISTTTFTHNDVIYSLSVTSDNIPAIEIKPS